MRELNTKKIKPNIEKWPERSESLRVLVIIIYRMRATDATFYKNRFQRDRFSVNNEISVGPS